MQAIAHSKTHQLNYPIRQGLVDNWNNMEKLWQRCYYDYLRVEPEEHYVLLVSTARGLSWICAIRFFHAIAMRVTLHHGSPLLCLRYFDADGASAEPT